MAREDPTNGHQHLSPQALENSHAEVKEADSYERSNLTENQLLFWIGQQLQPDLPTFNSAGLLIIPAHLDVRCFRQAFQALVNSSDALRIVIEDLDGLPQQRVRDHAPHVVEYLDFSDAADPDEKLQQWALTRSRLPFDFSDRLYDTALVKLSEGRFAWYLTHHQIIADALSSALIMRSVSEFYQRALDGSLADRVVLPSFQDYLQHERAYRDSPRYSRAEAYWQRKLSEPLEPISFYGKPTARLTTRVERVRYCLDGERTAKIRSLASRPELAAKVADTFLFSILATIFLTYLCRISGQRRLSLGTPLHNRRSKVFSETIGSLMHVLPLRIEIEEGETFLTLIKKVVGETVAAMEYSQHTVGNPLQQKNYEVMLNYLPASVTSFAGTPTQLQWVHTGYSNESLTLHVHDFNEDGSLVIEFEFDRDLFDEGQRTRGVSHFEQLLDSFLDDQHQPLLSARILTALEERQLIAGFNHTATEFPRQQTFSQLFEIQAQRTPHQVAVTFADEELTYSELNVRANRLARRLIDKGVNADVIVALWAHRGLEFLIAILGVFKAGGAYLPLDRQYPDERLRQVLRLSKAKFALVTEESRQELERVCQTPLEEGVDIIGILPDPEDQSSADKVSLDEQISAPSSPGNLAYVIYTSGSTGTPKGVLITQQGMINHLCAKIQDLDLGGEDVLAQTASQSFDISVWQFLAALLVGGRVIIVGDEEARDPRALVEQMTAGGVTVWETVPSMLQAVLAQVSGGELRRMERLRWLVVTGEALAMELCRQWLKRRGDVPMVNAYGPTECSDDVTHEVIGAPESEAEWLRATIGRPVQNTQIYIVDELMQLVPVGVPGELVVGGIGVGRGYLHDPRLTAQQFIPDPYGSEEGGRLYRTGDLGRHLADGRIEFIGRKDHQVKVRGYRIELGEIESRLDNHAAIKLSAVLVRDGRLVAYLAGSTKGAPSDQELRSYLKVGLSEYMIPSAFVWLDELPLTRNGKIDRSALPGLEPKIMAPHHRSAPGSPVEELLIQIWSELLRRGDVGIDSDFFESGGNSLLATQVISRVRRVFQLELPLRALFEAPTVAQFAQLIEASRRGDQTEGAGIKPVTRAEPLPLSFAQQRLWFLDQLEPGSTVYNIAFAGRLDGRLKVVALEQSLSEVVSRHEVLRTVFSSEDGRPVQKILAPQPLGIVTIDLSSLPEAERQSEIAHLIASAAAEPFDLAAGPLLRVKLLRLAEQQHVLLAAMHHIISDGWSMGLFLTEVVTLYESFSQGQSSPLAELEIQYADYAVWQREWLQGEVLEQQLCYWRQQLADAPRVLELPTDRVRPPVQGHRGGRLPVSFSRRALADLKALGQREGATLFMMLLTAFQVLLARYTGESEIVVGTPIANRTRAETEGLIGFFVNTLALRVRVGGEQSWRQLLGRVREVCLGAYAHQDVPFEKLVEELQPERVLSHHPLFQVMLVLQNAPLRELTWPELTLSPLETESSHAKFDLTLAFEETGGVLRGAIEYCTDLFDQQTVSRLNLHFQRLVAEMATDSGQLISRAQMLNDDERQQLLWQWNQTHRHYPLDNCLHHLFEAQVERTADAMAVAAEESQLSYQELNRRANQLAHYLQKRGVGPETVVGLCLERSVAMVIALLGVLKAGGAYLPLEPSSPEARLSFMMENAGAFLLVTQRAAWPAMAGPAREVIWLDEEREVIAAESTENLRTTVSASNLAYVIYTSGSTGRPKGVMVEHRQMVNYLRAISERVGLHQGTQYLMVQPLTVDSSATSIYPSLCEGGCLHVATREQAIDAQWVAAYLRQHEIDCLKIAPSHLQALEKEVGAEALMPREQLIIGGEAAQWEFVRRLQERAGQCRIHNHYGPTEATVGVLVKQIEPVTKGGEASAGETGVVALGRGLANVTVYVVDGELEPVAVGVVGELYLGGDCVARGYIGRAENTAERFLPDPYSRDAGQRLYRTGDMVRYGAGGEIEYVGRQDDQVKVRGHRIELGEVAGVLSEPEWVREAVVVLREEDGGELRLVAYVVPEKAARVPLIELRQYLRDRLPEHMIPSTIVELEEMPLTAHGKVDRRALPAPEHQRTPELQVAARTPVEELLVQIWGELLRLNQVGVHDNFFELGGHSLLATQVISRVRQLFQQEMPLRTLFEAPTIAELAQRIEASRRGGPSETSRRIMPVSRSEPLPLSFAQQRLWFLDQLEPGSTVYNIAVALRLEGQLDVGALEQSLSQVIARHEVLRTCFSSEDGRPLQLIREAEPLRLATVNLSHLPEEGARRQTSRLAAAAAAEPFDLAQGPLLRVKLLQLSEDEHVLLLSMHHIVSDGWSTGVLVREVATLYRAYTEGEPSPLADLEIQYADYAVWQRERLQGELLERQLSYWRQQLAEAPSVLELPTDRARPRVQSYRGAHLPVSFSSTLTEQLKALSQREGVTLFMTLLAAFNALLFRYSSQRQIMVGTLLANRTRAEIEPLIGFFLNAQPLLTAVSPVISWRELLGRGREVCLGAYAHQDVPFEKLVEELRPERAVSHHPLFQVMMILLNAPAEDLELKGLKLSRLEMEAGTAVVDLTLSLRETTEGIGGWIEYSTELFEAQSITRLATHFERLLEAMVLNPAERFSQAPMLTESELQQLLYHWNQTQQEYPRRLCLSQLFEAQVERTPEAVAVSSASEQLSYRQLNQRANRVAAQLRRQGVGPEHVVALLLERGVEFLTAMLAVFKAGGAYLPLDPLLPARRLTELIERSGAEVLLTGTARLVEMGGQLAGSRAVRSGGLLAIEQLLEDRGEAAEFTIQGDAVALIGSRPENLAYIIYTSGSTGTPKGVMITQQGMLNHLWAKIHDLKLSVGDVVAQTAAPSFDISVWQFLAGLMVGAEVLIVEEEATRDPQRLVAQLASGGATVWETVPSLLRAVLDQVSSEQLRKMGRLRWLVVTGEALELELCREWQQQRGEVALMNAYGPTECSDDVTHEVLEGLEIGSEKPGERARVAIGKPVQNTQIYVVDEELEAVAVGVVGEIVVGGEGVGRGYVGDGKETAAHYVPDPYRGAPGARLYRTGDMGRRWKDGRLEFVGRRDEQVKVRGFRIELGEVEATLRAHREVREALVMVRAENGGEKRLVAYVVGAATEGNGGELRQYLKQRLPEYMVPSAIVALSEMPLTANGKIDRRALPGPEHTRNESEPKEPAGNAVEELVAGIWSDVLGIGEVGRSEDFFELGGHSLLATQVISRIREAFEVEIPLRKMFEAPTVAGLATSVLQSAEDEAKTVRAAELQLRIAKLSDQEVEMMLSHQGFAPHVYGESESEGK